MRDTYIDKIDNVDEIFAFVSYEEYLQLPAFKQYVKERDVDLPPRCVREEEPVVEEVKPKKNAVAIWTGIFGSLCVVWSLACLFVALAPIEFPEIMVKLLGGWKDVSPIELALALGAVVLEQVFGVIVAFTRIPKDRIGAVVNVGTFLAFAVAVAGAIVVITKTGTVSVSFVVMAVIALLAFFVSLFGNKKKN